MTWFPKIQTKEKIITQNHLLRGKQANENIFLNIMKSREI